MTKQYIFLSAIEQLKENYRAALFCFTTMIILLKPLAKLWRFPGNRQNHLSRGKVNLKKSYKEKGDKCHG
ncbi:hypothetical protein AM1BK_29950 [Neobacillus kokaensis]|uniref:Transposase n=1 Tax=Neobacillus kokaensis TaxID=2759023 RepID=A0ABQ3N411_9BACI|nr:hypothetical protein AM1BK_29950 [Neobacillus kokaensis]